MTDQKMFPIMGVRNGSRKVRFDFSIPWSLIEPHAAQAQKNHQQTLERLAERGGLDATEALAVLEERGWEPMKSEDAEAILRGLVAQS